MQDKGKTKKGKIVTVLYNCHIGLFNHCLQFRFQPILNLLTKCDSSLVMSTFKKLFSVTSFKTRHFN